jgi:hypothetical protein
MNRPLPFFAALATFCEELAPIASPLVDTIGQTAAAVERAQAITTGRAPRRMASAADLHQFSEDD